MQPLGFVVILFALINVGSCNQQMTIETESIDVSESENTLNSIFGTLIKVNAEKLPQFEATATEMPEVSKSRSWMVTDTHFCQNLIILAVQQTDSSYLPKFPQNRKNYSSNIWIYHRNKQTVISQFRVGQNQSVLNPNSNPNANTMLKKIKVFCLQQIIILPSIQQKSAFDLKWLHIFLHMNMVRDQKGIIQSVELVSIFQQPLAEGGNDNLYDSYRHHFLFPITRLYGEQDHPNQRQDYIENDNFLWTHLQSFIKNQQSYIGVEFVQAKMNQVTNELGTTTDQFRSLGHSHQGQAYSQIPKPAEFNSSDSTYKKIDANLDYMVLTYTYLPSHVVVYNINAGFIPKLHKTPIKWNYPSYTKNYSHYDIALHQKSLNLLFMYSYDGWDKESKRYIDQLYVYILPEFKSVSDRLSFKTSAPKDKVRKISIRDDGKYVALYNKRHLHIIRVRIQAIHNATSVTESLKTDIIINQTETKVIEVIKSWDLLGVPQDGYLEELSEIRWGEPNGDNIGKSKVYLMNFRSMYSRQYLALEFDQQINMEESFSSKHNSPQTDLDSKDEQIEGTIQEQILQADQKDSQDSKVESNLDNDEKFETITTNKKQDEIVVVQEDSEQESANPIVEDHFSQNNISQNIEPDSNYKNSEEVPSDSLEQPFDMSSQANRNPPEMIEKNAQQNLSAETIQQHLEKDISQNIETNKDNQPQISIHSEQVHSQDLNSQLSHAQNQYEEKDSKEKLQHLKGTSGSSEPTVTEFIKEILKIIIGILIVVTLVAIIYRLLKPTPLIRADPKIHSHQEMVEESDFSSAVESQQQTHLEE